MLSRQGLLKVLLYIFILMLPVFAQSATDKFAQNLQIKYKAERPHDIWKAKAVEHAHRKYMSGFADLKILPAKSEANPDFILSGTVIEDELHFKLEDIREEIVLNRDTIDLKKDFGRHQINALGAINILIRNGGILDQRRAEIESDKRERLANKNLLTLEVSEEFEPFAFLIGGGLWGLILVIFFYFALGTLHGIERVWHWNILQYTRSYIELAFTKVVFFLFLTIPPYLLALAVKNQTNMGDKLFLSVFLPTALLLFFLVFSVINRRSVKLLEII